VSPRIELQANHEAARQIGPWLVEALAELKAPRATRTGELELALHELAINIVDHAYNETTRPTASYTIELSIEDSELLACFCDRGQPFVDDRPAGDGEPTVGGYGLIIVEQLAASVRYERAGDQNRWTLVFSP